MSRIVRQAWPALCACLSAIAHAQSLPPDSLAPVVDHVFARFTAAGPGCAVGIYQDGKVAFAKGYGLASLEYGVPITPTTPFIVGSVSKQFTAAAIALLVEQGRIALTDDVRKYVPELPDYGAPITIDNLVHHTSGLRDWWELVGLAGMRYDDTYDVQDVLDMTARQHGLNFLPGDRYLYSNTGYILLGVIVQRASGESLRRFAAEHIFGPLGMADTHFQDDHTEPVRGRAEAYVPASGGRYAIDIWNNEIVGQGGVMTTVLDLARWDENFYSGRVGGPAFLALQLQRGTLNDGQVLSYAFGLQVGTYRGLALVEHTGSTGGYRAVITRFPAQHTSFVALCNVTDAAPQVLVHQVADVVLRDRFTMAADGARGRGAPAARRNAAAESPPPALARAAMERLAGRYYSDELDATYEVVAGGPGVLLRRPRGVVDTLTARDSLTFQGRGNTVRFTLGTDGRAEHFLLSGGRVENIRFVRR